MINDRIIGILKVQIHVAIYLNNIDICLMLLHRCQLCFSLDLHCLLVWMLSLIFFASFAKKVQNFWCRPEQFFDHSKNIFLNHL